MARSLESPGKRGLGAGSEVRSGRHLVEMLLTVVVILVAVWLLHGPSVSMALTGDTYQWVQHAHRAAHEPMLLLADLDGFFRPSATWLLVLDRFAWGGFNAAGYRSTSLGLHVLAALALVAAGRRLGLGWPAAAVAALVWASSPYTTESVYVVACRHELLLLIPWLMLILVWPRTGRPWSAARIAAAGSAVLLAAAAKETWVVTPALVAALELERSRSWRSAVTPVAVATGAVVAYLGLYVALFHSSKSYLEPGAHLLAKLPNQLAAFFYLDELMVDRFTLHWTGGLATAVVAALVVSGVRWGRPGILVAASLLVAPNIPTLAIPYMPQRYLTIPFAGFVLLVVLWGAELVRRAPRHARVVRVAGYAAAGAAVAVGAVVVRADLEDYRIVASAHRRLLNETAHLSHLLDATGPMVVVRDEQTSPLHQVAASTVGQPKLFFVRAEDPYGLIDAAALFEWVRGEDGVFFEHVPDAIAGVLGSVVIHQHGGFRDRGRCEDAAVEAIRWRDSGRGVRIVRQVEAETRSAGSRQHSDSRRGRRSASTGMAYLDRASSTEPMVGGRPPDPTERSPS